MKNYREYVRTFRTGGKIILRARFRMPAQNVCDGIAELYAECEKNCNGWLENVLFPEIAGEFRAIGDREERKSFCIFYELVSEVSETAENVKVGIFARLYKSDGTVLGKYRSTEFFRASDGRAVPRTFIKRSHKTIYQK